MSTITRATIDAIHRGQVSTARELLGMLERHPPVPPEIDRALADALAVRRAMATGHGWSETDLDEIERRRTRSRAGATSAERALDLLAVLQHLPALPAVEVRQTAPAAPSAMLTKIRALLAKAESTTFPEEAESLSAKAQELMAKHRIDHVLVDGARDGDGPVSRRIWHDDPYADAKARLLGAVARANRCRTVVLPDLGCSHLVGFANDLDMTELLHTSLLVQATRAMSAHGPQVDERGRSRTRSFRLSFLIAYAWRVGQRLTDAATAAETDADLEAGGSLLPVLARRDEDVERVIDTAFPHTRAKRSSVTNPKGWVAGAAAAETADLRATSHELD